MNKIPRRQLNLNQDDAFVIPEIEESYEQLWEGVQFGIYKILKLECTSVSYMREDGRNILEQVKGLLHIETPSRYYKIPCQYFHNNVVINLKNLAYRPPEIEEITEELKRMFCTAQIDLGGRYIYTDEIFEKKSVRVFVISTILVLFFWLTLIIWYRNAVDVAVPKEKPANVNQYLKKE